MTRSSRLDHAWNGRQRAAAVEFKMPFGQLPDANGDRERHRLRNSRAGRRRRSRPTRSLAWRATVRADWFPGLVGKLLWWYSNVLSGNFSESEGFVRSPSASSDNPAGQVWLNRWHEECNRSTRALATDLGWRPRRHQTGLFRGRPGAFTDAVLAGTSSTGAWIWRSSAVQREHWRVLPSPGISEPPYRDDG